MPRLIKKCSAPSAYSHHVECGKEFIAYVDHQLYCSRTCANRAHRVNRYSRRDAAPATTQTTIFQPEIEKPITPSSEDGLRALGYGRREESPPTPKPAPRPDASAEPKKALPISTEDSPPDFRDMNDDFLPDLDDPYRDLEDL